MKEIFKDIPNYEGIYKVSNLGNVKSLKRVVKRHNHYDLPVKERILKPALSTNGYYSVVLVKKNSNKTFMVHALIAMAFLDHVPCGFKLVVDHINNIKTDNRLENIQIVSNRENSSKNRKGSSKYVGVSFHNKTKKFLSTIYKDGKNKNLGLFTNEYDAHLAYQKALKEILK